MYRFACTTCNICQTHYFYISHVYFRAGQVSWNKGTSIQVSSTAHERQVPRGKISEFVLLDTLKTVF